MKKLITTAFLMSLASLSYGQDANNAELADRLLQASLGMPNAEYYIDIKLSVDLDYIEMLIKQKYKSI
jgi:hypothetical protein